MRDGIQTIGTLTILTSVLGEYKNISNYKHRSRILNSEDIDDENDDIHKDIHKDVRQFPDIHKNYLDEL